MVKPNNEKHSVTEIGEKAREIHLALVDWAETDFERTYVIAAIQQTEATYQAFKFIREGSGV